MKRNEGYEDFRSALLDGRIKLGSSLTQSELCAILGISLSPLRETMTLLQAEGIITVRKRSGIQVFYPNVDFFRANFQMRTLIEREAVKRFTHIASIETFETMIAEHQDLEARLKDALDSTAFVPAVIAIEDRFHLSIANAFDNPIILEAHRKAYSNMQLFRLAHPVPRTISAIVAALEEHVDVLERCRLRDSEGAHDALDEHFKAVTNRVFGSL